MRIMHILSNHGFFSILGAAEDTEKKKEIFSFFLLCKKNLCVLGVLGG